MDLNRAIDWKTPGGWRRILTIDAHAAGEPLRVVLQGYLGLPAGAIADVRAYVREHLDHLRTLLMWEPRGHADMYGCVVTAPASPDSDFGVIFLHNEGYATMCGHGIIAVVTVALETGMIAPDGPGTEIRIDTPAGRVTARGRLKDGRVESVSFLNVPSFVVDLDAVVNLPGIGEVRYDLAFGGAFYAVVSAEAVGVDCTPLRVRDLIDTGMAIKQAIVKHREVEHPLADDMSFLYGTIFTAPATQRGVHSRNVCVFANGEVDRSPTGTGVSARVAIHLARGEIGLNEWIEIESLIGTRFRVRAVRRETCGNYAAVIAEVEGSAFITGRHEFVLDPADPLAGGFFLR